MTATKKNQWSEENFVEKEIILEKAPKEKVPEALSWDFGGSQTKDIQSEKDKETNFNWKALSSFKDISSDKKRFQIKKEDIDNHTEDDVDIIMGAILQVTKQEDARSSQERQLENKRLLQIAEGKSIEESQDNPEMGSISINVESKSTERNHLDRENVELAASAHEGKPKLSRRARAKANKMQRLNDKGESLELQAEEKVEKAIEDIVKGTIPLEQSVDGTLQIGSELNTNLEVEIQMEVPSVVAAEKGALVSDLDTPASEGDGRSDKVLDTNGTTDREGRQSLSLLNATTTSTWEKVQHQITPAKLENEPTVEIVTPEKENAVSVAVESIEVIVSEETKEQEIQKQAEFEEILPVEKQIQDVEGQEIKEQSEVEETTPVETQLQEERFETLIKVEDENSAKEEIDAKVPTFENMAQNRAEDVFKEADSQSDEVEMVSTEVIEKKSIFMLCSEKTEDIFKMLTFKDANAITFAVAVIQIVIPILLTYLLCNIDFVKVGLQNMVIFMKAIFYIIFFIGSFCISILCQAIVASIKK